MSTVRPRKMGSYALRRDYCSPADAKKLAEKVIIEELTTGSVSRVPRMLCISGVMELLDDDQFEAAVDTEEGKKTLQGQLRQPGTRTDIQSGSLVRWEPQLGEVDRAIRSAYDKQPSAIALRTICSIWERLDRSSELAAARSRLLLSRLEQPALGELPGWFVEQNATLFEAEEGELTPNMLALQSTELLVRAVVAKLGEQNTPEAEIEVGPLGRIVVDWMVPDGRLQWMVEPVDLPWPSVKVYQLTVKRGSDRRGPPETRILHTAFDVLEEFGNFLST